MSLGGVEMDKVKDIVNNLKPGQAGQMPSSVKSSEEIRQNTEAWAEAWRTLYSWGLVHFQTTDSDYGLWLGGVSDLSSEELENGILKAKNFKGFFNLPKFYDLCRVATKDLGLPESKQAYYEACLASSPKDKQRYSHPIVYMAGQDAGWFNLKNDSESKAFKYYDHYYQIYVERVRSGERFSVQAAITHRQGDAFKSVTPEEYKQARAEFKDLKAMLKGSG